MRVGQVFTWTKPVGILCLSSSRSRRGLRRGDGGRCGYLFACCLVSWVYYLLLYIHSCSSGCKLVFWSVQLIPQIYPILLLSSYPLSLLYQFSHIIHHAEFVPYSPYCTLANLTSIAKHFFSDPSHLVQTALHSLTVTNPSLAFDPEHKIIFRRPNPQAKRKVAIVSGGGSGHEPAFAGLVGKGLLDASIAGTIFASPSAEQIRKGVMDYIDNEEGVLIIPMNYTGDVLNFGMATEKARAAGIQTEFFAVNDDAGVGKKKGGKVGRRGIAGGILILKIVGALAEEGYVFLFMSNHMRHR